MMHESKPRRARLSLGVALLVGLSTFGVAQSANASSKFPAAMQKALTNIFPGVPFCVPLCTACHLTTAGGPGNMNVFGDNLEHQPMFPNLMPGTTDAKLEQALRVYFAATPAAGLPTAITNFPAPDPGMPTIPAGSRPSYDSDRDGISDYDELRALDSPSEPLPRGVGEFCPADTTMYGCFARVAAAPPPTDRLGLFSAGLVVLGLAAARRLKRTPRVG